MEAMLERPKPFFKDFCVDKESRVNPNGVNEQVMPQKSTAGDFSATLAQYMRY
jgi:hypothetical protein